MVCLLWLNFSNIILTSTNIYFRSHINDLIAEIINIKMEITQRLTHCCFTGRKHILYQWSGSLFDYLKYRLVRVVTVISLIPGSFIFLSLTLILFDAFFFLKNKVVVYNKTKTLGEFTTCMYFNLSDHGEWWSRLYWQSLSLEIASSVPFWFVVGVQFILYSELYFILQKYDIAKYQTLSVLDTKEP